MSAGLAAWGFPVQEGKRPLPRRGLVVRRPRRIAFGPLHLGRLPAGQWRELTRAEMERLATADRSHPGC